MAEGNSFILDIVATIQNKLNQTRLNSDIRSIQKQLNKLQLKAEISPKSIADIQKKIGSVKIKAEITPDAIQNITKQLEDIANRHSISISNININSGQAERTGQQMGDGINRGLSASLNNIRQNIENVMKGFNSNRLNSYDLSKMFNLNRADINSSVTKQVRELTNELNALAQEALKTNSDSAWQGIVNKINSLSDVLNKFGKGRDLSSFKESLDILNRFQGQRIFVDNKSEVLQNTGMSIRKLNSEFRNLGVTFTTVSKNSTHLDSIWTELFNISPALEKFTTFGDQLSAIVNHMQIAKEAMYGNSNLQPLNGNEATNLLLGWAEKLEEASKKITVLRGQEAELGQQISQQSVSSANTVVLNEQRKQEAYQQTAEKLSSMNHFRQNTVPQIQDNILNGFYAEQVQQQIEKYNRLGIELPNVKARIEELKTAQVELNAVMGNENSTIEQQRAAYINFQTTLRNAKASNSIAGNMYMSQDAVDNLIARLQMFSQKHTGMTESARAEIDGWITKLQQTGNVYKSMGSDAVTSMKKIQAEQSGVNKTAGSLLASLKKGIPMLGYWTSATYLMMRAISAVKNLVGNVHELDSALTNISYTMDMTDAKLQKIGESSLQMAEDMHTSVSNVLGAVKLYANAKETAESILQKAKPAIMLSNVTGFSGEESAKYLQTIMNQFDLTQDDLMDISDTIQGISQNIAHDFADGIVQINEGIATSGEVARAAGMDLSDYASMIGLLVEKTGLAGSQLGNSLKTIMTRTTRAGKIMGIDEGEISNAEKSLRSVGVEVRKTDGEFNEFNDTMSELAKQWDSLSDVEKSNISFNLAGTRQINVIQTLLRNWSDYEDLVNKANDSSGVTLENQSIYAESLTGKLGELSAVWEKIGDDAIDSSFLKGLTDTGIAISSLVEKLGLLKTTIVSVGIAAFLKNFA